MRKVVSVLLSAAMALSLCLAAQAAGPQVTVTLDGTALELEVPAYIDRERTRQTQKQARQQRA